MYIRKYFLAKGEQISKNSEHYDMHEREILSKTLLEQENIARLIAKYLSKSLELRDFLMEKQRQLMRLP